MSDETRTPDRVEHEIVRTRDELDHTLDVLGERFSAQELRQQAGDYVHAGLRRVGDRIQRNPRQAALASTLVLFGLLARRWYRSRAERRRAEQFATAVVAALGMPSGRSAAVQQGGSWHLPTTLSLVAFARPLLHSLGVTKSNGIEKRWPRPAH